ncbi:MAG: domain S-box protein, partial [Solirubrobacterales bacterium]|nr:domain S-box protein [Solirubrobacterales bacterium]
MPADRSQLSIERQLALLVDGVTDYAIFMLDLEGFVLTWNRGAERLKGYAAGEIIGRHFSTFYTPEDKNRRHPDHELQVAARDGRYEEEGWRVRKDGSRFWASVTITAIRDPEGGHIGYGKVTRDLTARRLTEDRLRANAAELLSANSQLDQFRRLVSSVRDYAIFMLDPAGTVATWNAGAENLKGYDAEEIIGRPFTVFYTDADRARSHPAFELETATREGRYEEEGWRVRKDGTRFWASVTITAVRGDNGELIGFAKVTRDLTGRREAEEALRAVNVELDRFASVAAHDLSDPLRTVTGFAELLEREELSPTAREYLGFISSTTNRMQRLLDSLLAYARAGEDAQPPEPVAVGAAAQHVLTSLAAAIRGRSAEVLADLPPDAIVCAGAADVELVLQNLVSNALKFGDPERPRVEISGRREGDSWRITVADNGIGIPEADRERIFVAFERAHAEMGRDGSGLGLAICERIVRRRGGSIGVD